MSLAPNARVIVAAFSQDGPESCAGLPVARYSQEELAAQFAGDLQCIRCVDKRVALDDSDNRPYVICAFAESCASG